MSDVIQDAAESAVAYLSAVNRRDHEGLRALFRTLGPIDRVCVLGVLGGWVLQLLREKAELEGVSLEQEIQTVGLKVALGDFIKEENEDG